jgi:polyhydroxyalkanoate synthesis regulator protein
LLQIILEEESGGSPLFSEQMLAQTISFYGHPMHAMMTGYLEKAVAAFIEIQDTIREQSPESYNGNNGSAPSPEMWSQFMSMQTPMIQTMMTNYIEQSKRLFFQMQEQVEINTRNMFDGLQMGQKSDDKK